MPRGSILVIDDEVEIREGLEALLTSESFQVTLAETGEAGLRQLEDHPFDLMLLDVSLPDRNGIELLREIRRRDPQLAVIGAGTDRIGAAYFLAVHRHAQGQILAGRKTVVVREGLRDRKGQRHRVRGFAAQIVDSEAMKPGDL